MLGMLKEQKDGQNGWSTISNGESGMRWVRLSTVFQIRVKNLDFILSIIEHQWIILSFMKRAYHLPHKNLFSKDIPQFFTKLDFNET